MSVDFKQITPKIRRAFVYLLNEIGFDKYVISFVSSIILFGVLFTILTPYGHGIGQNVDPNTDITILRALYFSVATISSLGYGDMYPVGFSRVLVCIEVLIGLGLIGIMIAKATSRQLAYHVSRLFTTEIQKRLEHYSSEFDMSREALMSEMFALKDYQITPEKKANSEKKSTISNFREVLTILESRCKDLHDYLSDESENTRFFRLAPKNALLRLGRSVSDALFQLSQLIISIPLESRPDSLDFQNRKLISGAIRLQTQVCDMVCKNVRNQEVVETFRSTRETCEGVREGFFAVPAEGPVPDQVLQREDKPQPTVKNIAERRHSQ